MASLLFSPTSEITLCPVPAGCSRPDTGTLLWLCTNNGKTERQRSWGASCGRGVQILLRPAVPFDFFIRNTRSAEWNSKKKHLGASLSNPTSSHLQAPCLALISTQPDAVRYLQRISPENGQQLRYSSGKGAAHNLPRCRVPREHRWLPACCVRLPRPLKRNRGWRAASGSHPSNAPATTEPGPSASAAGLLSETLLQICLSKSKVSS